MVTNELLARIFATYFNSQIDFNNQVFHAFGLQMVFGVWNVFFIGGEHTYANDCKLILSPLSEISQEDAMEVGTMVGLSSRYIKIERTEDAVFLEDDSYRFQISHNGYLCMRKNDVLYNMNVQPALDYLRSKSYDLGYGSIPLLISAGIAIENKNIK